MTGMRQTIQYSLALELGDQGETQVSGYQGAEPFVAKPALESPALTEQLMEEVCNRENLVRAWKRVRQNKGSPGVDRMTIGDAKDYLGEHWPGIRSQLLEGTYRPQPVKRVEIPKPDGGVRKLGVPCVVDRLIQQALLQVLQERWDPTFSKHSYGFRPGRSAHQAVAQAQQYIAEGLRPGQSRQLDGARRGAGHRQTCAQTHPGVSQGRGDGRWFGQPGGRGDPARSRSRPS
jgi:RNA-directed DNA polymerase